MDIPADYILGYERARAVAPEIADNYIAHTLIGDPLAEEMAADLAEFSPAVQNRLIQAAMNNEGEEALRDAPASLRKFFEESSTVPDWVDFFPIQAGYPYVSPGLQARLGGIRRRSPG